MSTKKNQDQEQNQPKNLPENNTIDESDDSDEDEEDKRTLFVCNLHEKITEELLYELFLQAGPIENVRIPKEKDGNRLKTFGFVTYVHKVSVPYALNLFDGIKLFRKNLVIKCRNQSKNRGNDSMQSGNSSLNTSDILSPMERFDRQAQLFDAELLNKLGIQRLSPFTLGNNLTSPISTSSPIENYQPNRSRDDSLHSRNRYKPYDREKPFDRYDKPYDRQKFHGNRRNDRFSDQRHNYRR